MVRQKIKAVEMTRQIRDRIYEQVKDLSPAEQWAFYRERALDERESQETCQGET